VLVNATAQSRFSNKMIIMVRIAVVIEVSAKRCIEQRKKNFEQF